MNLDEVNRRIAAGEIPTGAMRGDGTLASLIAFKAKGFLKILSSTA
jgi:hypothetical protein